MTREQKLALIIGFSLVLLVGVLVSDHLSGARAAQLADVGEALEQSAPPQLVDPLPDETDNPVNTIAAAPEEAPREQTRPSVPRERSDLATAGRSAAETFLQDLQRQFREGAAGAVPAAQTDPRRATETTLPEPEVDDPLVGDARPLAVETYRIKPGDSLWAIAERRYGDSDIAKQLAEYNIARGRLRDADTIRVGASILLPEPRALGSNAPAPRARAAAQPRTYTVKRGDTLGEIAMDQLGTSKRTRDLIDANKDLIDDPNDIRVGMVLKIPAS